MSPFAMFVLLLTIAYIIYYGVNICRDLFSKKGQAKSDSDEYEISDDEPQKKGKTEKTDDNPDRKEDKNTVTTESPTLVEEEPEKDDTQEEETQTQSPAPVHNPSPLDDDESDDSAEAELQEFSDDHMEECESRSLFSMDSVCLEDNLMDENSPLYRTKESE